MTTPKEKYIATLIGCGIGDALGMPVEGFKKETIQKRVGKVENFIDSITKYTKGLKKGEYTDDTILTLAIAESIADKKSLNFEDIIKRQIKAYESFKLPDGGINRGFGGSTKSAFEKIILGISSDKSSSHPGLGNGVCMKISPIGLYMGVTGRYNNGIDMTRLIGKSTHHDERAVTSGIVQAHAVYELLNNPTKKEFLESLSKCSKLNERSQNYEALMDKGNLTEKIKWIIENQEVSDEQALKHLGNSCVAFESYPFTIFMFQKYWDKPIDGLIETVNYGGDCDTTGAIFGALAGAKNGMIFPDKWVNVLQNKDRLKSAAEGIYNLKY